MGCVHGQDLTAENAKGSEEDTEKEAGSWRCGDHETGNQESLVPAFLSPHLFVFNARTVYG